MAATKRVITNLPGTQTTMTSAVEKSENCHINFRESLKFFQEQLIMNENNFPSPSSIHRTVNKIHRKTSYNDCEDPTFNTRTESNENSQILKSSQSTSGCKITIPTLDSILESVRVLRAIQKSQEKQGTFWTVEDSGKSENNSELSCTGDWIQNHDKGQNIFTRRNSNNETENNISIGTYTDGIADQDLIQEDNDDLDAETLLENDYRYMAKSSSDSTMRDFSNSFTDNRSVLIENQKSCESFNGVQINRNNCEIKHHNPQNCSSNKMTEAESVTLTENQNAIYVLKETEKISEKLDQTDFNSDPVLKNNDTCYVFTENKSKNTNKDIKSYSTQNSTSDSCADMLDNINLRTEEELQETMLEDSNSTEKTFKMETNETIDDQKLTYIFLSESSSKKADSSLNDSGPLRTESNENVCGMENEKCLVLLNESSLMQNDLSIPHDDSSEFSASDFSLGLDSKPSEAKECNMEFKQQVLLDLLCFEKEYSAPLILESSEELNIILQQSEKCVEKNVFLDTYQKSNSNEIINLELHFEDVNLKSDAVRCNSTTDFETKNLYMPEVKLHEVTTAKEVYDCPDENVQVTHGTNISPKECLMPSEGDSKEEDKYDCRIQKFTSATCDLISVVKSLYTLKENVPFEVLIQACVNEEIFNENILVLSTGAFCENSEDDYLIIIEDSILKIKKDSEVLCTLNMKYGDFRIEDENTLRVDNKMGRWLNLKCNAGNIIQLKSRIEQHCLKHWQTECLQIVHYPLKCHQNIIIVDLGSCSTRAGILMDQPTLPSLFFPTVCATNKKTGECIYGMEALQSEVRLQSNLSFPVRPTIKVTKHTIDISLLEELFKKIFRSLKVDQTQYTVQVCLPRKLSIDVQTALIKLLLENLKVKAVSLTNQALLTLYAHDVSTAVVVDVGERIDVLPVVDGFIVESGVTKLPHGGQRLIHHMKHALAEKRISLLNDIDSFFVQYIIENSAYIAEDYDKEIQYASKYPDAVRKIITLHPAAMENQSCKTIMLEEARFSIPEGLFKPDLWGLDSPGIHHLVQKAILATCVDARKRVAENIYVSGGVTLLPGFVERLRKEMEKFRKQRILPKVHASNYRYHSTFIGACKFAKMDVFPQVCINLEDFAKDSISALKKCALCF